MVGGTKKFDKCTISVRYMFNMPSISVRFNINRACFCVGSITINGARRPATNFNLLEYELSRANQSEPVPIPHQARRRATASALYHKVVALEIRRVQRVPLGLERMLMFVSFITSPFFYSCSFATMTSRFC